MLLLAPEHIDEVQRWLRTQHPLHHSTIPQPHIQINRALKGRASRVNKRSSKQRNKGNEEALTPASRCSAPPFPLRRRGDFRYFPGSWFSVLRSPSRHLQHDLAEIR